MCIFNMVVISRKALNDFAVRYPVSGDASLNWFRISAGSDWSDFSIQADRPDYFPGTDSVYPMDWHACDVQQTGCKFIIKRKARVFKTNLFFHASTSHYVEKGRKA